VADRINGVISVIEGAIQIYKNSPPELQQAVLVTLRASLMSGIGTLNEIISDNELNSQEIYRTAISDPRTRTAVEAPSPPNTPAEFTDVVPETSPAAETPQSYSGTDENSMFFAQVYSKLENAKGGGKMGVRQDLSADEASDLASDIADMRALLVDELENGIPDDSGSSPSSPTPGAGDSPSGGSSSRYQEMLAKARAEKESKKKGAQKK